MRCKDLVFFSFFGSKKHTRYFVVYEEYIRPQNNGTRFQRAPPCWTKSPAGNWRPTSTREGMQSRLLHNIEAMIVLKRERTNLRRRDMTLLWRTWRMKSRRSGRRKPGISWKGLSRRKLQYWRIEQSAAFAWKIWAARITVSLACWLAVVPAASISESCFRLHILVIGIWLSCDRCRWNCHSLLWYPF